MAEERTRLPTHKKIAEVAIDDPKANFFTAAMMYGADGNGAYVPDKGIPGLIKALEEAAQAGDGPVGGNMGLCNQAVYDLNKQLSENETDRKKRPKAHEKAIQLSGEDAKEHLPTLLRIYGTGNGEEAGTIVPHEGIPKLTKAFIEALNEYQHPISSVGISMAFYDATGDLNQQFLEAKNK